MLLKWGEISGGSPQWQELETWCRRLVKWVRLVKPRKQKTSETKTFLDVFKIWLDKTLNNLIWSHSWHCLEQAEKEGPPAVPAKMNYPMTLWMEHINLVSQTCLGYFEPHTKAVILSPEEWETKKTQVSNSLGTLPWPYNTKMKHNS